MNKNMLIGKNITKKYGDNIVLEDVDVVVERGKITTLIGPSGSGKTTLLRVMSLLDQSDSGTISIDGSGYQHPAEGEDAILPWPKISVVFQQLFLWPHLTLRQNILLPLGKDKDLSYMEELLSMFEMNEFIDRYPNQASLGQRQRTALVRALVLEPEYLLLDEITSALDIEQVAVVLKHLQMLRDKGVGILIVTHLLNFAQRASDQIVFLDHGRVLEAGGKEVLTKPKHERIKKFLSIIESAS
jgi:ABC-type polar amino acid transport system ATPase subunit